MKKDNIAYVSKQIWLISIDRNLCNWISKLFGKENMFKEINVSCILGYPTPTLILIGCDYKCGLEVCANKMQIARFFPDVSTIIVRPALSEIDFPSSIAFLMSYLYDFRFHKNAKKSEDLRILETCRRVIIHLRSKSSRAIRLQQKIIDTRGANISVSDLAKTMRLSLARLSTHFKQISGVSLKSFIVKIRACNALWELIFTQKSIKRIALDLGYRPTSFSLMFYKQFRSWPSDVRRINTHNTCFIAPQLSAFAKPESMQKNDIDPKIRICIIN